MAIQKYSQITIIGVGLLGASLAQAIRKKRLATRVVGICRHMSTVRDAQKYRIPIQRFYTSWEQASKDIIQSDVIVLCTPVGSILRYIRLLSELKLKKNVLITDIGSTKADILRRAQKSRIRSVFVGAHPMAGSEKQSSAHARGSLFDHQRCFVIKHPNKTQQKACERFWQSVGMTVDIVDANDHDEIVASVSHLPYVLSNVLLNAVLTQDQHRALKHLPYAGTGFHGVARTAHANPVMWRDILLSNRAPILRNLRASQRALAHFEKAILQNDTNLLMPLLGDYRAIVAAHKPIIAIDGPAGTGKSTVAKWLATYLGVPYLDTGAMYRAVTWLALERKVDFNQPKQLLELAKRMRLSFRLDNDMGNRIYVYDKDISALIRSAEVTRHVGRIADQPAIRRILVNEQRRLGRLSGGILEGRDIGTVVFPKTPFKFYLTATLEMRSKRRYNEIKHSQSATLKAVKREIALRDRQDQGRQVGGLKKASGAVVIDTTYLTIQEVAARIAQSILDHYGLKAMGK